MIPTPTLRALWLVCASKVYSGMGADIVYGIISLIIPIVTLRPGGNAILIAADGIYFRSVASLTILTAAWLKSS